MIFKLGNVTGVNYLETINVKSIDEITQDTKDLIAYFGKAYTDDEIIAIDDYFEGLKTQSYYSKIINIVLPFLSKPMTSAEILANISLANKAFYNPIKKALPNGSEGGYTNMFGNLNKNYFEITSSGITQKTILPSGTAYSLVALYSENPSDIKNFTAGMLATASSTRIGNYGLLKATTGGTFLQVGASTTTTKWNAINASDLVMINHSSTSQQDSIMINAGTTVNAASYNSNVYDTTMQKITLFKDNVDEVGKSFSFAFYADLFTPTELADFYAKTIRLLKAFGFNIG